MSDAADEFTRDPLVLALSLRQTGRCVMRMGQIVEDIEHHLFDGSDPKTQANARAQSLQSLDFLKQSADEIAALLERLADAVPQGLLVNPDDILRPMKLQELRDTIAHTGNGHRSHAPSRSDKRVELF